MITKCAQVQGSAAVQDERWFFSVIRRGAQKNAAATLEILYKRQKLFQHTAESEQGTAAGDGGLP